MRTGTSRGGITSHTVRTSESLATGGVVGSGAVKGGVVGSGEGDVNLAALRTAAFARTMHHAMMSLLQRGGVTSQHARDGVVTSQRTVGVSSSQRSSHAALVNALLACTPDGGYLMRNGDGSLREPELRGTPYDPSAPAERRLARFDDEPWQLWDDPRQGVGLVGPPTPNPKP